MIPGLLDSQIKTATSTEIAEKAAEKIAVAAVDLPELVRALAELIDDVREAEKV